MLLPVVKKFNRNYGLENNRYTSSDYGEKTTNKNTHQPDSSEKVNRTSVIENKEYASDYEDRTTHKNSRNSTSRSYRTISMIHKKKRKLNISTRSVQRLNIQLKKDIMSDEELFDIQDIDRDLSYLEIRRPNDEDLSEDEDFAEEMEDANKKLRDQVLHMIETVKDAVERVKIFKANRNKNTLYHTSENSDVLNKEKELQKYYIQLKKKLGEVKKLNKQTGEI